jgi:hypothetical protein
MDDLQYTDVNLLKLILCVICYGKHERVHSGKNSYEHDFYLLSNIIEKTRYQSEAISRCNSL